jgi:integrating conjugative element protein (TIGR03761 family)
MSILTPITGQQPVDQREQVKQPGVLRSHITLTLQTRNAQKFVAGRSRDEAMSKHQIPGLLDFGRRSRLIWLSVVADDPYADWQLLKTEALMAACKTILQEQDQSVATCLMSVVGLDVQPAESIEPAHIQLNFQNQYGYLAANLLSEYDLLACSIFSAMHAGILEKQKGYRMLGTASTSLRRLLSSTYEWRFTGVTRLDINNQTAVASKAIEIMGVCPNNVLDRTHRADHSPEIELIKTPLAQDSGSLN